MPANDYERMADYYDPLLNTFLDPLRKDVTSLLEKVGAYRVVDLCCGTGRQALFLHESGMEVMGVDLSPAMLRVARTKTPPEIVFHDADAANTGLDSSSFDAVLLSMALHELAEPLRQSILQEALRLLRSEGTLMIADYRQPNTLLGKTTMLPIFIVEQLAGREHYAGFKNFMEDGRTVGLLQRAQLASKLVATRMSGCIGIYAITNEQTCGKPHTI